MAVPWRGSLKAEDAINLVEQVCYRVADRIRREIPVEEYDYTLSGEVSSSFPGVQNKNGIEVLDKKVEHVIHWILFSAGIDIKEIGDYQNSIRVVYKNGFDPGLIPAGIKKYQEHIGNLAAKI
jgi:hypothetical protein